MLLAIDSKMLVPKGYKMKCLFSQVVKSLQISNVNCRCFNGRIISFLSTHLTNLYQVMTTERVLYCSTESDKLCMSLTRFCFVAPITSIEAQSTYNHYFVFCSCKIFYQSIFWQPYSNILNYLAFQPFDLSVPGEGYSRNALYALNLISTLYYYHWVDNLLVDYQSPRVSSAKQSVLWH